MFYVMISKKSVRNMLQTIHIVQHLVVRFPPLSVEAHAINLPPCEGVYTRRSVTELAMVRNNILPGPTIARLQIERGQVREMRFQLRPVCPRR